MIKNIKEFITAHADNPYSLGANSIEIKNEFAVLRYSSDYERFTSREVLKNAGIPVKHMSQTTTGPAFLYRYELNVWW